MFAEAVPWHDHSVFQTEVESYFRRENLVFWIFLAFQAGAVNTGGFLACHRFVSHVTGFATFFGLEAAQSRFSEAMGMLTVPLFFLGGAMLSAFFIDRKRLRGERPRYALVLGAIATIFMAVSLGGNYGQFGAFGEPLELTRDYALLSLLCLACGMQNGLVSTASGHVIRTTHLTGLTTDLGLGIVRSMSAMPGHQMLKKKERSMNWLRFLTIVSFCAGAWGGALLFLSHGYLGFALPALLSTFLFVYALFFRGASPT
jgi:uncharacterized membrane protein YoaK (UPF0700 family)